MLKPAPFFSFAISPEMPVHCPFGHYRGPASRCVIQDDDKVRCPVCDQGVTAQHVPQQIDYGPGAADLTPGATVRTRGDGIPMVIESCDANQVVCVWFNKIGPIWTGPFRGVFEPALLVRFSKYIK